MLIFGQKCKDHPSKCMFRAVILFFFIGVEFQPFINENQTGSKIQTGLQGLIRLSIYHDHDFWCSGGHRKVPWNGRWNPSYMNCPNRYWYWVSKQSMLFLFLWCFLYQFFLTSTFSGPNPARGPWKEKCIKIKTWSWFYVLKREETPKCIHIRISWFEVDDEYDFRLLIVI